MSYPDVTDVSFVGCTPRPCEVCHKTIKRDGFYFDTNKAFGLLACSEECVIKKQNQDR